MTPNEALLAVWALLAVYSVMMAIDLGAGGFFAWAHLRGDGAVVRVVERYATPVWESVNTFLVLLLLAMEAFFPKVINLYASILLVPLGVTFALLSIRQVGFAMRHHDPPAGRRLSRYVNPVLIGGVGLLVPLPAMTFFSVLQGHGFRLVHGTPRYTVWGLVGQPLTLMLMVLALAAEVHMAATFLTWFAELMGEGGARARLSRSAQWFGLAMAVAALAALAIYLRTVPAAVHAVRAEAWLWVLALASLAASLLARPWGVRGIWPVILSGVALLSGYMGLGGAQLPYLVRGYVTTAQAYTSGAMAHDLSVVFGLGFVFVVLPCVALLTAYLVTGAKERATR